MRRDAKVVPNKGSVPVGLIQGAIKYSKGPIRFSEACFEKTGDNIIGIICKQDNNVGLALYFIEELRKKDRRKLKNKHISMSL